MQGLKKVDFVFNIWVVLDSSHREELASVPNFSKRWGGENSLYNETLRVCCTSCFLDLVNSITILIYRRAKLTLNEKSFISSRGVKHDLLRVLCFPWELG